jgi:Phytanoyl-CoA dioxygenase (PhyH)
VLARLEELKDLGAGPPGEPSRRSWSRRARSSSPSITSRSPSTTRPATTGPTGRTWGHRPGQRRPDSFTVLAAIYLVDEQQTQAGNLWVWPGSHLDHQRLFQQRGTRALLPVSGHSTMLDPPPALREQVPVLARRGDLLLAHYLLGHNIGGNTTDRVRRIAYYRLGCPGHEARWEDTFLDAFVEYSPVRRQLAS